MKNAKIFIGISSNSSQVTGGIVGLTDRPVIGVPCTNENGDDYICLLPLVCHQECLLQLLV